MTELDLEKFKLVNGEDIYKIKDSGAVRIAQGAENLCKYVITDGNANVTVSDVLGIKIENFDDLKGYLERPRSLPLILNADITATEQIRAATNVLNLNGHNITSDGESHRFADVQAGVTLSIYGEGKISGFNFTSNGGCIVVNTGAKLKLNKVVFEDCKVSGEDISGGCIRAQQESAVEATDCTFKNCKSEEGSAGVAYLQTTAGNCTFVAERCVFDTCSANKNGGVFYSVASSSLVIRDSKFTSCSSQINGGGIYSTGTSTITDCKFTSCSSQNNGGSIYSTGTSTITDCKFTSCSASTMAGALYASGTPTITNCSFTSCSAGTMAGALYASDTSTITNCSFTSCSSVGSTGALYVYIGTDETGVRGKIINCTFENCTATTHCGALMTETETPTTLDQWIEIENVTIRNCRAGKYGGALINWGRLRINGITIQGCYATEQSAGYITNGTSSGGCVELKGTINISGNYRKDATTEMDFLPNANLKLIGPLTGICKIPTDVAAGTHFGDISTDAAFPENFRSDDGRLKGAFETDAEGTPTGLKWVAA